MTDELLLSVVNLVQLWRHEWTLAHVDPDHAGQVEEPVLMTRPWEPRPEAPEAAVDPDHFATPDELRAFFGGSLRYTPN